MTDFKFLHTADLHLDTPFSGISATNDEIGKALRNATLDAFDQVIEITIKELVVFVVIAGDIYDGLKRGIRAQVHFKRGLERLAAADIQTFFIHGNHDPHGGWQAIRQWPTGAHLFGTEVPESVEVIKNGERIAVVHGISFGQKHIRENLATKFERRHPDGFEIAILHTELGVADSPYAPCSLEDMAATGIDYWALGHIHDRSIRSRQPFVVYPGNPQGRSFNEMNERSCCVVSVNNGRVQDVRHVATGTVRFEDLHVDVSDCVDVGEVTDLIEATIRDGQDSGIARICRIRLQGRSEAYGGLRDLDPILALLREQFGSGRSFTWVNEIRNESEPLLDLDLIHDRGDLSATLLDVSEKAGPAAWPPTSSNWSDANLKRLNRILGADWRPDETVAHDSLILALDSLERHGDVK